MGLPVQGANEQTSHGQPQLPQREQGCAPEGRPGISAPDFLPEKGNKVQAPRKR